MSERRWAGGRLGMRMASDSGAATWLISRGCWILAGVEEGRRGDILLRQRSGANPDGQTYSRWSFVLEIDEKVEANFRKESHVPLPLPAGSARKGGLR